MAPLQSIPIFSNFANSSHAEANLCFSDRAVQAFFRFSKTSDYFEGLTLHSLADKTVTKEIIRTLRLTKVQIPNISLSRLRALVGRSNSEFYLFLLKSLEHEGHGAFVINFDSSKTQVVRHFASVSCQHCHKPYYYGDFAPYEPVSVSKLSIGSGFAGTYNLNRVLQRQYDSESPFEVRCNNCCRCPEGTCRLDGVCAYPAWL